MNPKSSLLVTVFASLIIFAPAGASALTLARPTVTSFRVIGACASYFKGMRQIRAFDTSRMNGKCAAAVALSTSGEVSIHAQKLPSGTTKLVGKKNILTPNKVTKVPFQLFSRSFGKATQTNARFKLSVDSIVTFEVGTNPSPPGDDYFFPLACKNAQRSMTIEFNAINTCTEDSQCGQAILGCDRFNGLNIRKNADPSGFLQAGSDWLDHGCDKKLADLYPPYLECKRDFEGRVSFCKNNRCVWGPGIMS